MYRVKNTYRQNETFKIHKRQILNNNNLSANDFTQLS